MILFCNASPLDNIVQMSNVYMFEPYLSCLDDLTRVNVYVAV